MTTQEILAVIRQRSGSVDQATARLTDPELVKRMKTAVREMALRKIAGVTALTVDTDPTSATYGVNPEPSDSAGFKIAFKVAAAVLKETLAGRVDRGELGISWQSGLEQESSIEAAKAYQRAIDDIERELQELIIHDTSLTHATRPQ